MMGIEPKSIGSLIDYLNSDLRRYVATGAKSRLKTCLIHQGFWASAAFRFSTYVHQNFSKYRLFRVLAAIFNLFFLKVIQILTGISIPVGCTIGKGLYIGHFGGIIISGQAKIGRNCNVATGVVIGFGRSCGQFGAPDIGDRVFIGPGAKIFGPVSIGNDASIGANAVVTTDIPPRGVAVGIPAKVVSHNGSFDYVYYDEMDEDPQRLMSMDMRGGSQATSGGENA